MERKKILIDTDVGTDFDDALALVLAAKSPEVMIKGVTTVTGDTVARAKITAHLLALCGLRDVPVAAGPREERQNPSQYFGEMDAYRVKGGAVELIVETARANPGLTIVTLAPLTNLAACIRAAPDVMQGTRLVMMGGMLSKPFPEGNIAGDPEAAQTVFASPVPKTMIGLDVTARCGFREADIRRLLDVPAEPNACLYRMYRRWKEEVLLPILRQWGENPHGGDFQAAAGMHDPMTVGYLLWPELFRLRETCVRVETAGAYGRGTTLEQVNPFRGNEPVKREITVAEDVDRSRLMERFMAVIGGGNPIQ